MKLLIEIPEEIMETKEYARYVGACSGELVKALENGIEFTGRPTGEWVEELPSLYYCSRCRSEPFGDKLYHYCPNCGARMKGETKNG